MYFAKVLVLFVILLQLLSCVSTNTHSKYRGCEIVNNTRNGLKGPGRIACFDKIKGGFLKIYYDSYRDARNRTYIKFSIYENFSDIVKKRNYIFRYTISNKDDPIYLYNVCYKNHYYQLYAETSHRELRFKLHKMRTILKKC